MTAPTLVVPGNPADWLPEFYTEDTLFNDYPEGTIYDDPEWADVMLGRGAEEGEPPVIRRPPAREWLAVETLPVTPERHAGHRRAIPELNVSQSVIESSRPLRAGDTVTLRHRLASHPEPFAEATVAEVLRCYTWHEWRRDMTLRGPAVLISESGSVHVYRHSGSITRISLPDATPGGWAIRLCDVKETT